MVLVQGCGHILCSFPERLHDKSRKKWLQIGCFGGVPGPPLAATHQRLVPKCTGVWPANTSVMFAQNELQPRLGGPSVLRETSKSGSATDLMDAGLKTRQKRAFELQL